MPEHTERSLQIQALMRDALQIIKNTYPDLELFLFATDSIDKQSHTICNSCPVCMITDAVTIMILDHVEHRGNHFATVNVSDTVN